MMVHVDMPAMATARATATEASDRRSGGGKGSSVTPPAHQASLPMASDDDDDAWADAAMAMAPRNSRSQSLTDPRTLQPHLLRLHQQQQQQALSHGGDTAVQPREVAVTHHQQQHHQRLRMRRTKSAELGSLSLLQQELGYPRAVCLSPTSGKSTSNSSSSRRRGSARRSHRRDDNTDGDDGTAKYDGDDYNHPCGAYSRPAATSDALTFISTDSELDHESVKELPEATPLAATAAAVASELYRPVDEEHPHSYEEADEEEENFLDNRVASVSGYARDTDGVVYYEIVVESTAHGPLSAYKVRRRYSEFRQLHRALARLVPPTTPRRQETLTKTRRLSLGGYFPGEFSSTTVSSPSAMTATRSMRSHTLDEASILSASASASAGSPPLATSRWLPPLSDNGGLWSYLQRENPQFLETRARSFGAILHAAQQNPQARASRLLNNFLGPPPDSFAHSNNNNYVSLNRFAAPTLRLSVECKQRKEVAKTISLKRRQRILELPTASTTTTTALS